MNAVEQSIAMSFVDADNDCYVGIARCVHGRTVDEFRGDLPNSILIAGFGLGFARRRWRA